MYEYDVLWSADTPAKLKEQLNEKAKEGWRPISIRHPVPEATGFRNPIGPIVVVFERNIQGRA